MTVALQLPAARTPVVLVDPQTGAPTFSRTWYLFFQAIYSRIGGSTDPDITIDHGVGLSVEGVQAIAAQASSDLSLNPQPALVDPQLFNQLVSDLGANDLPPGLDWLQMTLDLAQTNDALRAEVGELREQFAELRKAIDGLGQMTSL